MAQAKDQAEAGSATGSATGNSGSAFSSGPARDAGPKPNYHSATSRISSFSPFRKVQPNGQMAGAASPSSPMFRGLGDVSEVPSISKPSGPVKPPKPAGLRVKKAKALSISLLTGGGNGGGSGLIGDYHLSNPAMTDVEGGMQQRSGAESTRDSIPSTSRPPTMSFGFGNGEKRQSNVYASSSSPRLQQQPVPADDGKELPARSWTAMDHYKEHGPTKGLASRGWGDVHQGPSYRKKLSDWDNGRTDGRDESDELFIIARSDEGSKHPQSPPPSVATQERKPTSPNLAASHSDPQTSYATYDADWTKQEKASSPSRGDLRRQSSLGIGTNALQSNKLQPHSASGSAASPFLNPYTARAQVQTSQVTPRQKVAPTPLGRAAIVRSSYRSNLGQSGPVTAPMTLPSPPVEHEGSSPARSGHTRTISTFSANPTSPSSAVPPRVGARSRTQSHSGLSPAKDAANLPERGQGQRSPSPLPPPRHKYSKTGVNESFLRVPGNRNDESEHLHPRSSSPFGQSGALQAIGQQLGGVGVAVGRGWDLMRNWNSGGSSGPTSPLSPVSARPNVNAKMLNEATRIWLAWPDPTASTPTRGAFGPGQAKGAGGGGGVFGSPLREAVIKSRLAARRTKASNNGAQLSALDLGSEFSINLPDLQTSVPPPSQRKAVDRMQARRQYLPAVVVRCVESIERCGMEEEGIYRLSGRSSHTAKLKVIFDNVRPSGDLELVDIGPAELDLNSVCSLLKAYLRSLPDLLITGELAKDFNRTVQDVCGMSAVSEATSISHNREKAIREQHEKSAGVVTPPSSPGVLSVRIATAIKPLMSKLPAVNWYLLREIAWHLGDLTKEEAVRQTKMPLSNLCLVLAPTLSLSVAMVRVLVEAREQLFDDTCPLVDDGLDGMVDVAGNVSPGLARSTRPSFLPRAMPSPSAVKRSPSPRMDARSATPNYLGVLEDEGIEAKRASVATVKPFIDVPFVETGKRSSTSSVVTVQQRSNDYSPAEAATSRRPTAGDTHLEGRHTDLQHDGDGDEASEAPIAAHFIRKRSASIANSISSNLSSNVSVHIQQAPSSTSLFSNALPSSTVDSSVPSLADRDSPQMVEDGWQMRSPAASNSSGSFSSLGKTSSGAIDRPRPTPSKAPHFFSSRSGGGKTAKVRESVETSQQQDGRRDRVWDNEAGPPPSRLPVRSRAYTVDVGKSGHGDRQPSSGVDEAPIYVDQVRRMWQSNNGH